MTYVALEQFAPTLDSLSEDQRQLIEEAYAEEATDGSTAEALLEQQMSSTRVFTGLAVFLLLVLAAIYTVPTVLLYRFSVRVRQALDGSFNAALFSSALQAHRRMYKFVGILTLGLFVLYMFFFLGSALLGAALQNYKPVGG